MSARDRITSGECKPSGYREYDNLTGYITAVHTSEWVGADGTRWRRICTVYNLGRPDRGIPVDPDRELDYDPWETDYVRSHDARAAIEAHQYKASARRDALQQQVVAYLMAHGPHTAHEIATGVGYPYENLKQYIRKYSAGVLCDVGNVSRPVVWGVCGIHTPLMEPT